MSLSDYTRNILNIKDKNITFEENCLKEVKVKNTTVKVFHGKLSYTPCSCPKCGCLYEKIQKPLLNMALRKTARLKLTRLLIIKHYYY